MGFEADPSWYHGLGVLARGPVRVQHLNRPEVPLDDLAPRHHNLSCVG